MSQHTGPCSYYADVFCYSISALPPLLPLPLYLWYPTSGEHPRMGALDVCPFIPLMNTTTEDCIECSKWFGEALSAELGVPVFLYEYAATAPHRKHLGDIRRGEYEGMKEKVRRV